MSLPLYPLHLVDILGSALGILLSLLSLSVSLRLQRKERENIFWTYLLWLSSALTVFAFSRGLGHILQYILVFSGHRETWETIAPISGSFNTLSFVFVGTVSLFFVGIRKLYQSMASDKTRMEEINLELMNLNREMESVIAERTLNMIALSIADRIRNPATVIGGTASRILKAEGLSTPLKERLMDFLAESQKLDAIVKDYETILRKREPIFNYEDLNEMVRSSLALIEREIQQKSVELSLDLPEIPLRFNANRQMIRVAIVHVLKNAVEAASQGGRITVSTGLRDNNVFLDVADTGRGIPDEDLKKIFSLFFSTKRHRIGMGLPLVKQIVEEHRGTISVDSEVGKGTIVRFSFPVRWLEKKTG